ncbi:unnamed protein product [Parnassius apollo]|uniref:Innexin n=1 Tax=Parnassius apollo TaxID=110799 RepID=A0A8S3W2U2_PARAO|nr:unnamed protein product [Parnassius apollo]
MIDLLPPFRSFLKYKSVCTDNNVFRLHYKITVIMLLMFTVMVTSKQFFGEPIHCMSESDENNDKDAINNYCWIYGTYTLKSQLVGIEGKHMAYAGVGPSKTQNDEQIKHTYYQWVCFVLLGQAVMFYIPHYLWKSWEGGRLKDLAENLNCPIVTNHWTEQRRDQLLAYFNDLNNNGANTHNMYALRFAFCELLNLLNVIGQIFLLDLFLGGSFRNYGTAVAAFTHSPRLPADMTDFVSVNPMDRYFPKLTKCWFRSYGPSGSLQLKDRLAARRIAHCHIRDHSNPFDVSAEVFTKLYRLSKRTAHFLVECLHQNLNRQRQHGIPVHIKVLASLHFFGHGGYQTTVGQGQYLGLSQPSVSKCLQEVADAIITVLLNGMVLFPETEEERAENKQRFLQIARFPSVLGLIDCSQISIVRPKDTALVPARLFFNRKGFYSLNCQFVCNAKMEIIHFNATFPGSTHDAAVWQGSSLSQLLETNYVNGVSAGEWLLGDSGYAQLPWLMTPSC